MFAGFPGTDGTWQTQEQSFVELLLLDPDVSCLSSNEQTNEVQSSLLFPTRQSESPHQKSERVKVRMTRKPTN